jgi:hypothetical protein
MSESKWFSEEKLIPDLWSWILLILLCAGLMGWGMLVYLIVPDGPRHWDYRKMPDVPGESAYGTRLPSAWRRPSQQMPKLPGARPLKPEEMSLQEKRP